MKLTLYEDIETLEHANDIFIPYHDISCNTHGNPRIQDTDELLNEIVNAWNTGDVRLSLI